MSEGPGDADTQVYVDEECWARTDGPLGHHDHRLDRHEIVGSRLGRLGHGRHVY